MASHFASTQMISLQLQANVNIKDTLSEAGKIWAKAIHFLETETGPKRVYWGVGLEAPEKVHIHIVRGHLQQHYDFLASQNYESLKTHLGQLTKGEPRVIHAHLAEWTPNCSALGKGAQFTGTAIYLGTDESWDHAWSLWATIVPNVPGCAGVAGGYIVEPLYGHQRCFIAWVGWDSVKEHDDYHHTDHFRERRIILRLGNRGYEEYGHVCFPNPIPTAKI